MLPEASTLRMRLVVGVGDVEVSGAVHGHADGIGEAGAGGGTAVAAEAWCAIACHYRELAGGVHLVNPVGTRGRNIDVPGAVHGSPRGYREIGVNGSEVVGPTSGDGLDVLGPNPSGGKQEHKQKQGEMANIELSHCATSRVSSTASRRLLPLRSVNCTTRRGGAPCCQLWNSREGMVAEDVTGALLLLEMEIPWKTA